MTTPVGRSVRLFLVDGSPTGVVTAEIVNWTGHALLAPRSDLGSVRKRSELQKTGVYFLLGEVATVSERRRVYIGESDDVGRRIEQHASSRDDDFFERFCVFTSKDANLTKAHARYLENRFTNIARNSGRAEVLNSNVPPAGVLPESDIADMEFFIAQGELVLPVLGFDILKSTSFSARPRDNAEISDVGSTRYVNATMRDGSVELVLMDKKSGIVASATLDDSEYIVRQGSTARSEAQRSLREHLNPYFALREALIGDGSLRLKNGYPNMLEFTRDVVFKSPSAASAVILGRSDNGRRSWRVKATGEELAEYQNRMLREAAE